MFPFHTWLPDAHTDAPTAGSVILAAVLLKMGTYGFLRFSLPILPDASRHFVPMIAMLSIIGIVYGALVALAQKDWKRLVAYSSVSHMALVMLGMFALNPVGITGSIIQQLNHGISTGALFLLVGVVYERRHTREISEYGGLSKVMPVYAADLPDHDDVVDRAADAERVHRRVPDPAGRLRQEQGVGGVCGQRRRAGRGLHALSLPADDVRQDREPEERGPVRSEPPRVRHVRAADRARGVDGPLSVAVPAPPRDARCNHIVVAREPAIRGRLRRRRADDGVGRGQQRRAVPRGAAVRAGRQAAAGAATRPASTGAGADIPAETPAAPR